MPRKIKKTNQQLDLFNKEHNKLITEQAKKRAATRKIAQERLNKILERHKKEIISLSKKNIFEQQEILKKNLHNYVFKKNIKASDLKNQKIAKTISEANKSLQDLEDTQNNLNSEIEALEDYKKSKHKDFNSLKEYENDVTTATTAVGIAYDEYLEKLTKLVVDFRKDGVLFEYK